MTLGLLVGFLTIVMFCLGRNVGVVEERVRLQSMFTLVTDVNLYRRVVKLAELKGEDITKVSVEEIIKRMKKLKEEQDQQK